MRCRRPPDERETMPTLYIEHMNNQETEIVLHLDTGPFGWEPTPEGLLVTLDRNGSRTVYPWPTVKSYTIMIDSSASSWS
jgi:hypothetical protein